MTTDRIKLVELRKKYKALLEKTMREHKDSYTEMNELSIEALVAWEEYLQDLNNELEERGVMLREKNEACLKDIKELIDKYGQLNQITEELSSEIISKLGKIHKTEEKALRLVFQIRENDENTRYYQKIIDRTHSRNLERSNGLLERNEQLLMLIRRYSAKMNELGKEVVNFECYIGKMVDRNRALNTENSKLKQEKRE